MREAADHLVDIHGQHAWQSLTRPRRGARAARRAGRRRRARRWRALWSQCEGGRRGAGPRAHATAPSIERERERLAWQVGEVERLAPADGEWDDAERRAPAPGARAGPDRRRAHRARGPVRSRQQRRRRWRSRRPTRWPAWRTFDARLAPVLEVVQGAQAQLQDAAHTLSGYLQHTDIDPERLAALDARLAAWIGLARRYRRAPEELAALVAQWQDELRELVAATDTAALERTLAAAESAPGATRPARVSAARAQARAQTRRGGHAGDAAARHGRRALRGRARCPRPSRSPSASNRSSCASPATPAARRGRWPRWPPAASCRASRWRSRSTTVRDSAGSAGTLIFDEIDAGIGGAVADTVGRLMKQLGRDRQVLAVTHLAQVAACADQHLIVTKATAGQRPRHQRRAAGDRRGARGRSRAHARRRAAGHQPGPCAAVDRTRHHGQAPAAAQGATQPGRIMIAAADIERPARRRTPRRADHRHLGFGQVGGAARARGRRLLLRRQPAARVAARLPARRAPAQRQRPPRRDRGRRAQRRLAAAPAAADRRAAPRRRRRSRPSSSTPAPTRWCGASPRRGARTRCRAEAAAR